jgi:ubiquinone biosynthesis protein UbiJ
MSFSQFLQEHIDEFNEAVKRDNAAREALKQYNGKRVVLSIAEDTSYAITISTQGLSLLASASPNSNDMYIEMENATARKLLDQGTNPLEVASMIVSQKIKMKNIGPKEIDLVRRLARGF